VAPRPVPSLPLVIGLGNEHRRDDGCGIVVARRLGPRLGGRATVVELEGEATRLLDLWAGREVVLVVDAVRSNAPVGTVRRFRVEGASLPAPLASTSTHGLSLAEAVALGSALGRLPPQLIVYGIEVEDLRIGVGLSARVAEAATSVADRIEHELRHGDAGVPDARGGPSDA
jgi:hydrogenase maturation protease